MYWTPRPTQCRTASALSAYTPAATAEVIAVREDKNILTLNTVVTNLLGEQVISGEAVVLPI